MSMSMVSAGASLPRFERLYGAPAAPEAANRAEKPNRVERRDDDDDDSRRARRSEDSPGRRNPLVSAMMQALQGLMAPGRPTASTVAATAPAPTAAPAPSAPTTPTLLPVAANDGSGGLKAAAIAFASELFSALRSLRGDEARGRGGDYRDLAQGLRALARTIEVPGAGAPTPAPAPAPVAPAPRPAPAPVSTAAPVAPVAAPAPGMSLEVNINLQIRFTSAATATNAPDTMIAGKEESPLLAAFKRLMEKLNPIPEAGSITEAGATTTSLEEKLKAFLLTIADALTNGRDRRAEPGTGTQAPVGGLLSIAA